MTQKNVYLRRQSRQIRLRLDYANCRRGPVMRYASLNSRVCLVDGNACGFPLFLLREETKPTKVTLRPEQFKRALI